MRRLYTITFVVTIFLYFLDRLTKYWSLSKLDETIEVIPGLLELTFVPNTNFLFYWQFPKIAIFSSITVVLLLFLYLLLKEYINNHHGHVSIMIIIIMAAFSNLLDRIKYGYVIDFISVPFWSVFNLADVYILCGALVLSFFLFRSDENLKKDDAK